MTPDVRLYLVTGPVLGRRSLAEVVEAAVEGGVTLVQFRLKGAPTDEVAQTAADLVRRLGEACPVLVDDDVDAAVAAGAAGVHLGPDDLDVTLARERLGPRAVIGWSVHGAAAVDDAAADASYVAASPVWPTPTKPDTTAPFGLDGVATLRRSTRLPLVGIGGIDVERAGDVVAAGADGVAVVSAICSAADPRAAAVALRRAVDEAVARRGDVA